MIKGFFQLIKPGIILANIFSVLGGIFFCNYGFLSVHILLLLLAVSFLIASGCVFNNIIDIDIDRKMVRTQKRILVTSHINIFFIKIYGILLLLCSILIFFYVANFLSLVLSLFGFLIYVIVYSMYVKRKSIYSTMIGGIAGAIPPMVGYCFISNTIDIKSILLFLIFYIWQIPHSYSIYIIYEKDYYSAGIPNIVITKGIIQTIKDILFYIFIFILLIFFLYYLNFIHYTFFIVLTILNMLWLFFTFLYYLFPMYIIFARILFYCSLIIIIFFNILSIMNIQ